MKTAKLKIAYFVAILFISISCNPRGGEQSAKINTPEEIKEQKEKTPDIADSSFKDGMTGKVFHNYLQLKMSLVNSDNSGAKTASGNMAEAFTSERAELKSLAEQIANSDELETQRKLFSDFTNQIEALFKSNLAEGKIYKQYCPMAFDNKGAFWFSDVAEIRNPYFGEKMLNCGSVEETIE